MPSTNSADVRAKRAAERRAREARMPECSIDSCLSPAYCRGWCSAHYQRWYHHGDPLREPVRPDPKPKPPKKPRPPKMDPEERRRRKKERQREYAKRPDVVAARREYERERRQRPDVRERRVAWERKPEVIERRRQVDRERRGRKYIESPEARDRRLEREREYSSRPDVKARARDWNWKNGAYRARRAKHYREQKLLTIPVTRTGRFTPGEDKVVMRADLTVYEICYMLGRSYASVTHRRNKLSHRDDEREPGRAEMKRQMLRQAFEENPEMPNSDISRLTGVSDKTVAKWRVNFGF